MSNANVILLITAENKASQVLQDVQGQATKTQESINQANERTAQSIQKVERNYLQAGAAFAAVGASVAGFVTSLDNMERAQLKVDVAQKRVHDLLARGKEGTEEYRIAQEKLRLAQDNLSDSYVTFISGIGPQVFSTIFGLQAGFKALGITSVSQLIPAIKGVGIALKTTFITNPVGIAILAITTVIGLLVFNVGGLRDRIVELGNQILAFLDQHLKPLADAIRFIIDLFKPLGEIFGAVMPEEMGKMQDATSQLEGVVVPSFDHMREDTLKLENTTLKSFQNMELESIKLGTAIGITSDQIVADMNKTAIGVEATLQRNIENFGRMGRTARLMSEDVAISMAKTAAATEIESSKIVLAGSAIAKVLEQIRSLQGGRPTESAFFGGNLPPRGGFSLGASQQIELGRRQRAIDEEINRLTRVGQSLALAGGLTGEAVFGGGFRTGAGTVFSSDFFQALTPGGTLVSKLGDRGFILEATRIISDARAVLERGFVRRSDIIRAQHGFEGIFDRPTFLPLMVAEGGMKERVSVGSVNSGRMKLIVQFEDSSGNDLGSITLDDRNESNIIRLKTLRRRMVS